jgi:hypothetical protein
MFLGPGSGSGSIIKRYGSGSFYYQAKIVRKNLDPMKNDANVQKEISRKTC